MLVIHSMRGGGAERQMSYLANEIASRAATSLVTLDETGNDGYPLDPRIQRIGLKHTGTQGGLIRGLFSNFGRIRKLRRTISAESPDVVLSFCDTNNILTLLACPKSIPVVISERSDPQHQRLGQVWERLRGISYPRCRLCVVQTQAVADQLLARHLMRENQLRIIPSAIRTPPIDPLELRRYRESLSNRSLVYVGRLSKEKRVDRLLKAWSEIHLRHRDWTLDIVGDGAERESLQTLATQFGCADSVRWKRWSNDVWSDLQNAQAYALVSQYEGFPQSMLEAMASGLPVAVLNCSPAIPEVITDGANGLILPDEASIAPGIEKLLSSSELRNRLGQAAAVRAQDYEWSRLAPRWLQVFEDATKP